ncbi:ribonuclease H family protein [Phyllobacterium brassicacearum]|uniref:Ribonuclease H family protein n=1 Tax=Phyllobacterium brassicacearum TaxID=314235 RepID=A0A2P7BTA5_9HYPH|nr:ACT domain-containing protein [Phyllobacterium brassicacearum]PSH69631.1 ribonuclease H family protein [Phyllobacterium brassicacearum]TDQ30464.1 hypothetical protein DEV91_10884 [Phyllobacterium brassicacearum]
MPGETDLKKLLATMQPWLHDGIYVFATLPAARIVPSGLNVVMTFHEAEGLTLILDESEASRADLAGTFPSRMITLEVHSSLEAVGFLAAISARLAAAGIGVNPVSAFYHDHLFVPVDRADEAMRILERLAEEAKGKHDGASNIDVD